MRHRGTTQLAGVVVCLALGASARLAAQEAVAPAKEQASIAEAPTTRSAGAPRIEERFPSLYYLRDEQGKLQPVPNFTLEEFEDLFKLKNRLVQGDPLPRFSLQRMLASGKVNSAAGHPAQQGSAELTVHFRIFVREDQWTRIPLRLDQAVLLEPAQYQGPGEHLLTFQRDGEGYVAWIHGPANQIHELTLKLLVPLSDAGQETRFRLTAPRTTASELRLNVPYAKAVARASEGATLQTSRDPQADHASMAPARNQETELIAVGLNGDCELSWHPPGATAGKPPALEASGTIVSRLDGRGVETEATFSVRSYGEPFDHFHIRLPPETELVPGNPSGYTLTASGEPRGQKPAVGGQLRPPSSELRPPASAPRMIDVRLPQRTVGPVDVHFSTKRTADLTHSAPQELAGFEIPEAARQGGTIVVSVAGDWQVVWGASRGVRQIDQTPESLRQKDVVAVYEYFALPSSLTARLANRRTRINVEPEYIVLVDRDEVRLEARLRYTVRGAKIATVNIAVPDWQIDEVGPESVVAVDAVPDSAGMSLSLPLVSPTVGQFEIRFKAHRALASAAKSFSIALPQPQATRGAPPPAAAVVAVLPADNVEIVPSPARTTGMLRQQAPMMLDLPLRQQEPLFYRTDASKAVFTAELRRHHRRTTAAVSSQVVLSSNGGRVEQKFSYSIAYEPTDYLLLQVPRELAGSGRLELSCEDQPLVPVPLGDEHDNGTKALQMRVGLPRSCIGRCDLTARYSLPPENAARQKPNVEGPGHSTLDVRHSASGVLHVPLVMPLEAEFAGNTLTVVPAEDQQVEVVGGDWTPADTIAAEPGSASGYPGFSAASPAASGYSARAFTSSRPAGEAVLDLRSGSGDAPVIVQRAWLQTCLPAADPLRGHPGPGQSLSLRQDQLVVQFVTRRRQLEVTLPPGAVRDEAVVRLFLLDHDGAAEELPVVAGTVGDRGLTVPLPPTRSAGAPASGYPHFAGAPSGESRYVLSLQYCLPCARAGRGPLELALPHFGDDAWVSQAYWQLLLPPQEHLVAAPDDFTAEFLWRWNNLYYGRQPVMNQADLEAWTGLPPGYALAGRSARLASGYLETGMNCYLFSAPALPDSCKIVTVGRSTIIFLASGAALLAGLALIYVRAARHPVVLLAATILLAGGAARYPELALLAAQAAVLGLILALLALVLRRWLAGSAPIAPLEAASSTTRSLRVPPPSEPATHSVGAPAGAPPPPASGYPAASSSKAATVPPPHSAGAPTDAVA